MDEVGGDRSVRNYILIILEILEGGADWGVWGGVVEVEELGVWEIF